MYPYIKKFFNSLVVLLCYPLFGLGQIWLNKSASAMPELSERLTIGAADWTNAHLLLIIALMLIFKTYLILTDFVKPTKAAWMGSMASFISGIVVFVLFGQYVIDLTLPEIYKLPTDLAEKTLDNIQQNKLISFLFTGPKSVMNILPFADLMMIMNILIGVAFMVSKKVPAWAIWIFWIAFALSNFGRFLHPEYGRLIKRSAYALFSIAFIPVVLSLWKTRAS